jgi:hypothetical protein
MVLMTFDIGRSRLAGGVLMFIDAAELLRVERQDDDLPNENFFRLFHPARIQNFESTEPDFQFV